MCAQMLETEDSRHLGNYNSLRGLPFALRDFCYPAQTFAFYALFLKHPRVSTQASFEFSNANGRRAARRSSFAARAAVEENENNKEQDKDDSDLPKTNEAEKPSGTSKPSPAKQDPLSKAADELASKAADLREKCIIM